MSALFVDIDSCPVYPLIARAAQRHSLDLYAVTRGQPLEIGPGIHLILAPERGDGGSDWIAGNIRAADICITVDARLAARCLLQNAIALAPTGKPWTHDTLLRVLSPAGKQIAKASGSEPSDGVDRFAEGLEDAIAVSLSTPSLARGADTIASSRCPPSNPQPRLRTQHLSRHAGVR